MECNGSTKTTDVSQEKQDGLGTMAEIHISQTSPTRTNVTAWQGSKSDFWALLKASHFDSKDSGQKWKMAEGFVIDGS